MATKTLGIHKFFYINPFHSQTTHTTSNRKHPNLNWNDLFGFDMNRFFVPVVFLQNIHLWITVVYIFHVKGMVMHKMFLSLFLYFLKVRKFSVSIMGYFCFYWVLLQSLSSIQHLLSEKKRTFLWTEL